MPTYGWVFEDSWSAYLEATDRVPPPGPAPAPKFKCPFCVSLFEDRRELQDHVSDRHHVARPVLSVNGKEIEQRTTIRTIATVESLVAANATKIELSINGGQQTTVAPHDLEEVLANARFCEALLLLHNESQPNATPVSNEYVLSFRIAKPEELKDVEMAFDDAAMSAELTRSSIATFLDDARCSALGRDYAEGLASYALGVLLKERPTTEKLTTPFARYRENYGAALRILTDFPRPYARLISDVIRFALNDFATHEQLTGYWELDVANALLKGPNGKPLPRKPDETIRRRKVCPIDHGTGQIIDLAVRMSVQERWSPILDEECRQIANSGILDLLDRQKALAIWALMAWRLEAKEHAIEPLRLISATFPFNAWAERYLETVTQ